MKIKIKYFQLITLFIISIFYSTTSFAAFFTGHDLREPIREYRKAEAKDQNTNYIDAWTFRAFVIGAYDATENTYCGRIEKTHQLLAIVANYHEKHPEEWGDVAVNIVSRALMEAFRCP